MSEYDIAIVGAGPGGYVAAIRAAQLGMRVSVIEGERAGGVCLNWGCIPSKAILRSAELYRTLVTEGSEHGIRAAAIELDYPQVIRRSRAVAERLARGVESLFKKNGVALVKGWGRVERRGLVAVSSEPGGSAVTEVKARRVLIATGSTDRTLAGVERDGRILLTSRDALALTELPRSLVIIGGGAVGVEFAYMYNAFGTEVTLLEMEAQLLPGSDPEVAEELSRSLRRQGIKVMTGARVEAARRSGEGVEVTTLSQGATATITAERLLMAIGRKPLCEGLGLDCLGLETENGFIKVNRRFETNCEGVFAIGDVIGPPLLAHVASEEGIAAVEFMVGKRERGVDYRRIPACTYCQPEVASVGLTEAGAAALGIETVAGRFPFRALGKAVAIGHAEGFVKIVADKETHEVLGCHIIGTGATDMIAEAALLCALEGTTSEVAQTVHAHPTLSEALMEAALAIEGGSINF